MFFYSKQKNDKEQNLNPLYLEIDDIDMNEHKTESKTEKKIVKINPQHLKNLSVEILLC